MQSVAVRKMELSNNITRLPDQKLDEIERFVKGMLAQMPVEQPQPISLKGIWKNKGFEKIAKLELEIKRIRSELSRAIMEKEL